MDEETRSLLETLPDLRVVDLKRELEKRKLPKSGSKKELCERLRSYLKNEEPKAKIAEKNLDSISSLNLPSADAGMENNEFVKSYLEQREKLLERQMEQKKKYQEEAYKSQESESQSEAEDITQNVQQEPEKQQDFADVVSGQSKDVSQESIDDSAADESKESNDAVAEGCPEYNSETDEDTEDESGKYSTGSPGNVAEPEKSVDASEEQNDKAGPNGNEMCRIPCDGTPEEDCVPGEESEGQEIFSESVGDAQTMSENAPSSSELSDDKSKPIEEAVTVLGKVEQDSVEAVEDASAVALESSDANLNESSNITETECTESSFTDTRMEFVECKDVALEPINEEKDDENRVDSKEENEKNEMPNLTSSDDDSQSASKQDLGDAIEESRSPRSSTIPEEPLEVTVRKEDEFDEVKATDENSGEKSDPITTTQVSICTNEQEDKKIDLGVGTSSKRLVRATQELVDVPLEKPARKRKWGSVELESQSVTISSDSFKGLIPEVMLDLSVPCDAMMDVIGTEDVEVDAKSRIFKKHSVEMGDDGKKRRMITPSAAGSSTSTKLGRTIYQDVVDIPTIPETSETPSSIENEKHKERRVVERKISVDGEAPERNVVIHRNDQSRSDVDNASKKRRINPTLQPVDEPVAVERGRREMTPPRNPVSRFIHIFNLVRPYTLHQLKEILQRTGTLVETGFWIDKIKSHCIAEYETSEQAVASREALHGKRWPACNPKILRVDFSDENELEMKRNAKEGAPVLQRQKVTRASQGGMGVAAATAVVAATAAAAADAIKMIEATVRPDDIRKTARDGGKPQEKPRDREFPRRRDDVDRRREESRRVEGPSQPPIREWDRNKARASNEQDVEASVGHRKRNSSGRLDRDDIETKRHKRLDMENEMPPKKSQKEEPPAKLLDDLFRKTKTTPCIYWLPLTEEQIAEKEKQAKKIEAERMQRRAERDKKIEEERDERMRVRAVAQREREGDRRRDF